MISFEVLFNCLLLFLLPTKSYAFGGARTFFRLILQHGDQQRPFRMDLVSNKDVTLSEVRFVSSISTM